MSEIKIVTMINGPPVIAKTKIINVENKGSCYILEDPLSITYSQNAEKDDSKFNVHDTLSLSTDSTIEVMVSNVLYTYTPVPEIVEQYNAMLLNKLTLIANDKNEEEIETLIDTY